MPIGLLVIGLFLAQCSASDNETWQEPTKGLVTTVKEVSEGEYKILSEETVPYVRDSRVIVENLDGETASYTLDEVKMIQQVTSDTSSVGRPFRSASHGYFGYLIMGRMMSGGSGISSSAYVSPAAHQKASTGAGTTLRNSARSVSRPSGRSGSGFGGSRSSRSYGG